MIRLIILTLGSILVISEALTNLDDGSLQKLDVEVRRQILPMIATKINQTLAHEKALAKDCENKINAAIQSCKSCQSNICQPTVVDEIKHVAENVGHSVGSAIKHIFGKRSVSNLKKRCSQSCPICDTLDIKKHSKEQTLIAVCGASAISAQKNDINTIKRLRERFDAILHNHLVTRVDYDTTTIRTNGGVSFTLNFITYMIQGHNNRFQSITELKITDIPTTAKSLAHQIFPKI
ncbi:uncharacterized protein LOC143046965 isoform X2 [Mytilus galloprovincialis]|uniref:uncharacterized protein LOC143046965 isoform X2 n=1 Tax=Mytilus galloprovincialis TaxID=29158 RepID=UPI003F7B73DC